MERALSLVPFGQYHFKIYVIHMQRCFLLPESAQRLFKRGWW